MKVRKTVQHDTENYGMAGGCMPRVLVARANSRVQSAHAKIWGVLHAILGGLCLLSFAGLPFFLVTCRP